MVWSNVAEGAMVTATPVAPAAGVVEATTGAVAAVDLNVTSTRSFLR